MATLSPVGTCCPNPECPTYGHLPSPDSPSALIKFGRTRQGRQRYRCRRCGQTFTDTKGTLFYRRRTPEGEILETLALLADGASLSSLARATGHKEDTIRGWLEDAGRHAEALEEVLLADYSVDRGQLDALWSFVRHKGEKKATPKPKQQGLSGGRQ